MENLSQSLAGLVTTREVADRYGLTVRQVHHLITTGTLKPVDKLPGLTGTYLFAQADLPESLEAAS